MKIAAIPTTYAGVRFRSRLEARWAVMFDALGWSWEYEPLDLNGWIPDFLITIPEVVKPVLGEVKPVTFTWREHEVTPKMWESEYCEEAEKAFAKIHRAIEYPTTGDYHSKEQFHQKCSYEFVLFGAVCPNDEAYSDEKGVGWWLQNAFDWYPADFGLSPETLRAHWREAGNVVQWKAPK